MKLRYRVLWAAVAAMIGLVGVLAVRTAQHTSVQVPVQVVAPLPLNADAVAGRLAGALRFATISSHSGPGAHAADFDGLHSYLREQYPRVHANLQREVIGGHSLLYTWPGSDAKAEPMLLMAHQDVVPVASGTESQWQHPPFAGRVADGFVWGRGAWDNKANLIAQFDAVEALLASGFTPRATVYLVFGHDEEVGGTQGAAQIAELLKGRGVRLGFVLDEGLLLTEGLIPGLSAPAALIGVAEKGYLSVIVRASAVPGHSSMPPSPGQAAVGMLAAALRRLDDQQLPAHLRGVAREMFETLAPEMQGFQRVALSNLWLFGPLVQAQLEKGASTNAMLRTTTALTMLSAGNKDNVLPAQADGTVNFRIIPGESRKTVTAHVNDQLATLGDGRFQLFELPGSSDPSPVSPTDSEAYRVLNRTVREIFPGTVVAPSLLVGGTDSRHFTDISDHVFRFSPVRARPDDLARFHGTNERIAVTNLVELVQFYHRLIRQTAGPVHP